jgi:hypothetical protein
MIQAVSDFGSNAEENIEYAAKIIGKSALRKTVFIEVYKGRKGFKRVSELEKLTPLKRKAILTAGKKLADSGIVKQKNLEGEPAYGKIPTLYHNKNKILSLVASPKKLAAYPTRRKLRATVQSLKVQFPAKRVKVSQVTIGDIDSFRKAWRKKADRFLGDGMSESQFKAGIKKIVGEKGEFKDWPGETSDLSTTFLSMKGRRVSAALALKGPAQKRKLTPKMMGIKGDQISRLFTSTAELFLVQYCRQIDQSVVKEMETCAISKSYLTGERIYFGIIDGQDSLSLVRAYPKAFKVKKG